MATDNNSKGEGDFRYGLGSSKVPWTAVGEFYDGEDAAAMVKFLLPEGSDEAYPALAEKMTNAVVELSQHSGRATKLTLGKNVQAAEEESREYFGSKYACMTANWTSGMEIAYKLSGLRAGDEVIMPAITFIATMAYPLAIGAKVVFADIDPATINLDPADVERKITPKTKMIVPVHLGGYPVDMEPLMAIAQRHGIFVMEDAAHGMGGMYHGKRLGTIGHFGGFSLHEVKNINSLGEGGLLLTNEDFAGAQLQMGRFLGLDASRQIKDWLYDITPLKDRFGQYQVANNCSVTELQALGLRLQLKRLDQIIAVRRAAAEYTNAVLSEEPGILVEKPDTADTYGTHHLYLLRIDPKTVGGDIQTLGRKLKEKGLTNITHFGPMYRFNIMKQLGYNEDEIAATCPNTETQFYHSYTHLPLYPLTQEQVEYQAHAIVEAVREMKQGK